MEQYRVQKPVNVGESDDGESLSDVSSVKSDELSDEDDNSIEGDGEEEDDCIDLELRKA